jgi:steroid delta-isomerase-like uncharacterized protein
MWSTDELKALANRFFEYFNDGNLEGLDKEVIGEEYVQFSPGVPPTRESIMTFIKQTMNAYPDGRFEVDDMIAEGDKVLIRWTFLGTHIGYFGKVPPTGKEVTITGMDLWRFNDQGKIAEAWFYMDMRPFFSMKAARRQTGAAQEA